MNCNICFEKFNTTTHLPLTILPCTHVYCKRCISRLQICPTCRVQISSHKQCFVLIDILNGGLEDEEVPIQLPMPSRVISQLSDDQNIVYSFLVSSVYKHLTERYSMDLNFETLFNRCRFDHMNNKVMQLLMDSSIGLCGKGGVGKTTVISKLCAHFDSKSISFVCVTPTHTAATVLQEALGLDATIANDSIVKTLAHFIHRNDFENNQLKFIDEKAYVKVIRSVPQRSVSYYDVIIFDESSMLTTHDIVDIGSRLKSDYDILGGSFKMPCLLFCGDIRQLGPIEDSSNSIALHKGFVSCSIFMDNEKCAHLTKIIRSSDNGIHELCDSIGDPIQAYMTSLDKSLFSFVTYDKLLLENKSSNIIKCKFEEATALYANMLKTTHNPKHVFWLHYNNVHHINSKKVIDSVRPKFLGIEITDYTKIIAGDFVIYKLQINDSKITLDPISIHFEGSTIQVPHVSNIKPGSRFKVVDIISGSLDRTLLGLPSEFIVVGQTMITVEYYVLYTRQDKIVYHPSFSDIKVSPGVYNTINKCMENITVSYKDELIFSVPVMKYREYKDLRLRNTLSLFASNVFALSYVGSAHTAQGNSIDNVFVGEYNIRNQKVLSREEIFSSLYTCMTRTKKKMFII